MQPDRDAEQRSRDIAARSPEGTPANPRLTAGNLVGIMLIALIPPAVIAIAVYYFFGPPAAIAALVVGVIVCFLANPAVWATFFRARERAEVDERESPRT